MALVLNNLSNRPQTHALVIGVGGYPHMPGGVDPRTQVQLDVGVLKQLTSPAPSAVFFTQWLLDRSAAWRAPVGTVDLLVTPAPGQRAGRPATVRGTPATMANIRQAYDAWKQRCDSHPDNIAVFYFCGHGLEKSEQYLLAEDFGADPNNSWLGSFGFDSTRAAFHECKARTQCFFIDACRVLTTAMLRREPVTIPLATAAVDTPDCAFDLTMKASAKNEAALGSRNAPSYFVRALVRALDGGAAVQGASGWVVRSGQVADRITDILRMVKEDQGYSGRCPTLVGTSTELLTVPPPQVELVLDCAPTEANAVARLSCRRIPSGAGPAEEHLGGPWSQAVEAGYYEAKARFEDGRFRDTRDEILVLPPRQRRELNCTR